MSPFRLLPLGLLVLPPLLAGCDSLGLGGAGNAAPPARAIDYRTDDLSQAIFAFDLPSGVQPVPKASTASLDAGAAGKAGRHLKASLVLADASDIDGQLPPPAAGRTYYLLGFGDKDKAALREAASWFGKQNPAPAIAFVVAPNLCATQPVDIGGATLSVTPVLPGQPALQPLIASAPLAAYAAGGKLPACKD